MTEEDKVAREISVFLSKCLCEKLYLLQYPQRPASVSLNDVEILETKIKPHQNKLQLVLGLDTESEHFDNESAKHLAEAAEGLGLDEDQYMPDRRVKIDKTTLEGTSVPKLTESKRYVIGLIRDDQVTLIPLKSTIQMKTVFPYLNKADKARAAHKREKDGGHETEDETEESEAQKVTVKFSRNTASAGENKGPSRVTAYSVRKREEEEKWLDLSYDYNDPLEYEKLYSSDLEIETPFYVLNSKNYLEKLFTKHTETEIEGVEQKKKNNPKISVQQMRLMTVPEQLRVLLINAKLLQYHQIQEFLKAKLKSDIDETSLLRSIQTVGILVQGCWVVRSEVIFPDDFKSSVNGITGIIMQRARDLILSQFTEYRFVERRKMIGVTRIPTEEVTEILQQISRSIPKKGWEFRLPYDSDFVNRFPDVVQRQTLIWDMKNQNQKQKSSINEGKDRRPSGSPSRRRSRNISFSSDGESSENENKSRRRKQSGTNVGGGGGGGRQRRNSTARSRSGSVSGIPTKVET